jgi:hypothetical protein
MSGRAPRRKARRTSRCFPTFRMTLEHFTRAPLSISITILKYLLIANITNSYRSWSLTYSSYRRWRDEWRNGSGSTGQHQIPRGV